MLETHAAPEFSEAVLLDCLSAFPHVELTVTGDCMRPALEPGERVRIARVPPRWGDVVLLRDPEGLRLHRLVWGPPLPGSTWRAKGDRSEHFDPPLAPESVLGTVIGARRLRVAMASLLRALFARIGDG